MKSYFQTQQQQNDQNFEMQSQFHQFGSNSDRMGLLASAGANSVADAFALIAQGSLKDAKDSAHQIAENARRDQDNQTAQYAGHVWTVADSLGQIQEAINSQNMSGVQQLASSAADLTRTLMSSGVISQGYGERVLESTGGYWNMANTASKENTSGAGGAADTAQNSETVDQHKLSYSRGWAYCGIATSLMMLYANGKGDKNNVSRERDQLVSEMYHVGVGTDVDGMASALRKRGLTNSQSTRNGNFNQLLDSLDAGQPVPFGIMHMNGTIVKLNKSGSSQYPHKREGDRHQRTYGNSGHWVLVVDYEGSRENPTHFILNDPDLGGQIRTSKAELESMGLGNGNFFQVYQK